ncbi:DapH/DapD/GlmU-related protein, partial [Vibrio splendidus]
FIYYIKIKYIGFIKKLYYKNLFKSCGENLLVYGNANIKNPSHIVIGKNCTVNDNVYLNGWSKITIGNNVALSASCMIISTQLNVNKFSIGVHEHDGEGIVIGNNVQVGAGAIILDGVTIGDDVVIGAGSVVTKNIEPGVIVAGVPATILRKIV